MPESSFTPSGAGTRGGLRGFEILVAVAEMKEGATFTKPGADLRLSKATLCLATPHFGLGLFASLFGAVITFGALTAAAGPMIGGWLPDITRSYDTLLVIIIVIMMAGAATIALIGEFTLDPQVSRAGRKPIG